MLTRLHPYFFINKSPRYLPQSFKSTGLSVQEKKRKIDFQDGGHGCQLRFSIETILPSFDLQVILMLSSKFRVSWLLVQKKRKIGFQNGVHRRQLGLSIEMILASVDLQVTLILSTKFPVDWPFGSGGEAQNPFPRSWRPSWISNQNDLTIFDFQVTLMLPTKFQVNWPLDSGEEEKNRFSRW